MKQTIIFYLVLVLFLASCVYDDPFEEYATKNLSEDTLLTSWDSTDDLVLQTSAETPPDGEDTVYMLGFPNLINGGTFEGGTTGFQQSFTASAATINSDSQMSGTNYLELTLSRDSGNDIYYHTFDVTSDNRNFKFKFDYQHVAYENIQISYGESTDDIFWEIKSVLNNSGTVIKTFSVDANTITPPTDKEIRFGLRADNSLEKSFHVYLDNIALYEDNGHRISTTKSISETGVYKLVTYAKAISSDKITLELGGETKTWDLTSSWQEVQVQANGFVSDGSISMAIIPTGSTLEDEFPGYIYLTEPKLYFLPEQADPQN